MNQCFIHPQAICESTKIGADTRIWAFTHILPHAVVGKECNINDGVFIENDVIVGDRVTIKCGVQLWDGLVIEDDVFVGPNATFTNDPFPRSKKHPEKFLKTIIRKGASIGANATILPGLEIGEGSMVGAGSVVTQSVPPYAIVAGNPARITGYVNSHPVLPANTDQIPPSSERVMATQVRGVTLHRFTYVKDMRGNLSAGEFEREIPFVPKRYFLVFDVPSEKTRGQHAHKACHQFLVCVKGRCAVVADDGQSRQEFMLDSPDTGIYLPPLIWGIQYKYSPEAVLLVFASDYYDPADYIRNYDEFVKAVRQNSPST